MNADLNPLVKINLILLLFFLIFGGLYFASNFLIPLAFAAVLAMLMTPMCVKLEQIGVNKMLASLTCIMLLVVIFAGLGILLSAQIASFTDDLPQIEREINKQLASIQLYVQETFGISPQKQEEAVKDGASDSGGVGGMVVEFLNSFTGTMAGFLLTLVYMFFLLYYRARFPKFILKVVDEDQKERAHEVINDSSRVAQQYLVGRGILIVLLAAMYSVGLTIAGLENAIFLSVIAGLLSIIPYIGNIIAFFIFIFMALAQGGGFWLYINITIVFSIVQLFDSYVLEPFILGAEVDIHPFFTVVIIIVGEQIWGVAGMILAIPLLGIIKIIFSHIDSMEPYAYLIGDTRQDKSRKTSEKIADWFSGQRDK